ncbi:hypothetical protein TNCV_1150461 [Trichonephila clavipes]|nr:hypothetical protein TNCV_1150461 [Trichonephila clavipes]
MATGSYMTPTYSRLKYPNSRIQSSKSCTKLVEREGTGCRNSSVLPPPSSPMGPALGTNLPSPKVAAPGMDPAGPPLAPALIVRAKGMSIETSLRDGEKVTSERNVNLLNASNPSSFNIKENCH